jgi:hypothetical protein
MISLFCELDSINSENNNNANDGRVRIADFSSGQPPAQVKYWEDY